MSFYADLHIHSKYSRATSRDADLEHLALWAEKKGIAVIGTGDFTHPAWREELKSKLAPAEPGLFRLKDQSLGATRFMLEVEISTIYKKGEKTRKVHHLLYAPDFEKVDRMVARLEKIGNLRSDGRPILGLDSRHLLEIALEAGEGCYLVPAHIWTPWFSAMGSKSGFDSIDECYGDLASHIFAVETGLSSDPEMNWRVSHLDRFRLVSNSDAHSPGKLGREACRFSTELDYFAIKRALETGEGYEGTIEFFPEEGKYHLDGHRKCGIRFDPNESKQHANSCPTCGEPLTLGVLHRVEELADRQPGQAPEKHDPFVNAVPLPEVLSELLGAGPASKKVQKNYNATLNMVGPELPLLNEIPLEDISKKGSELLAEAIRRMRAGEVKRTGGYDGEYGVIKLFEEKEIRREEGTDHFWPVPGEYGLEKQQGDRPRKGFSSVICPQNNRRMNELQLDSDQQRALEHTTGPLLIVAGPGSGKTRTLTHRIAHLIEGNGIDPASCLTITFTRRAAEEMRTRLKVLLPHRWAQIPIMTFHGFALAMLDEHREELGLHPAFRLASEEERIQLLAGALGVTDDRAERLLIKIARFKRVGVRPSDEKLEKPFELYECLLKERHLADYEDLIRLLVQALETREGFCAKLQAHFPWLSVDEFQDIDEFQYRLIKLLMPADGNICAIGDPDQAIYGFRGSDVRFFLDFQRDFPAALVIRLTKNYRSRSSILDVATGVMRTSSLIPERVMQSMQQGGTKVIVHQSITDRAEADFIVQTIEQLIGGSSHFSVDSGRSGRRVGERSFSDFAVLYRTDAQSALLVEALELSGLPFQKHGHRPAEGEEAWDPRAERILLLTIHAAKGLEFPVVFIVGCEDGVIPLRFGDVDQTQLDEERRLFFVGVTRAREQLILSYAQKRLWRGKLMDQELSPFIQDVEQQLLDRQQRISTVQREHSKADQLKLF